MLLALVAHYIHTFSKNVVALPWKARIIFDGGFMTLYSVFITPASDVACKKYANQSPNPCHLYLSKVVHGASKIITSFKGPRYIVLLPTHTLTPIRGTKLICNVDFATKC